MTTPLHGSLIVTGGSPGGIGAAILNAFSPSFAPERVVNLDVRGTPAVDVRDYEAVRGALSPIVHRDGINYLFHAAGLIHLAHPNTGEVLDFYNTPPEMLRDMVDINLTGTIYVLRAYAELLQERGTRGNAVVVSSISAHHPGGPGMAVYGATKAAISWLCQHLVPNPNFRLNVIEPGSVRTRIGGWSPEFGENQVGLERVRHGQDGDAERLGREVSLAHLVEEVRYLFFADHARDGSRVTVDFGLTLLGREGYNPEKSS